MANAYFTPVLGYAPGSAEKEELQAVYAKMKGSTIDAPMFIGDKLVTTDNKVSMHPPHDHQHLLGHFNMGTGAHVTQAIDAALAARDKWASTPWQDRAAIFLKATLLAVFNVVQSL